MNFLNELLDDILIKNGILICFSIEKNKINKIKRKNDLISLSRFYTNLFNLHQYFPEK